MLEDDIIKTAQIDKRLLSAEVKWLIPVRWLRHGLLEHEQYLQDAGFAGAIRAEKSGQWSEIAMSPVSSHDLKFCALSSVIIAYTSFPSV